MKKIFLVTLLILTALSLFSIRINASTVDLSDAANNYSKPFCSEEILIIQENLGDIR